MRGREKEIGKGIEGGTGMIGIGGPRGMIGIGGMRETIGIGGGRGIEIGIGEEMERGLGILTGGERETRNRDVRRLIDMFRLGAVRIVMARKATVMVGGERGGMSRVGITVDFMDELLLSLIMEENV